MVVDSHDGLSLIGDGNKIQLNTYIGNGMGIVVRGSDNVITNNTNLDSVYDGVPVWRDWFLMSRNLILGTLILQPGHTGFAFIYEVNHPTLSYCGPVAHNTIESGAVGIKIETVHHSIRDNTFINN